MVSEAIAQFNGPPVTEVGFSVVTADPQSINLYDLKGLHQAYDGFPVLQRQSPAAGLNTAALVGAPPAVFPSDFGLIPRWWFVTEDEYEVIQVQERFWSYNWRRNPLTKGALDYPGYDELSRRAKQHSKTLIDWHQRAGGMTPSPVACELLYIDTFFLPQGSKLGDYFAFWNSRPDAKALMAAFNISWLEQVPGNENATLNINVAQGQINGEEAEPSEILFQMAFTAGAVVRGWDDVFAFYDLAHSAIGNRFSQLITEEAAKKWA